MKKSITPKPTMKKAVFVTTTPYYFNKYFKSYCGSSRAFVLGKGQIFAQGATGSSQIYLIAQIDKKPLENAKNINDIITDNKLVGYEIYIAAHNGGGSVDSAKITGGKPLVSSFSHGTGGSDKVFNAIETLCKAFTAANFTALCAIVKKQAGVTRFTSLKHSINGLFGPLDIDLQAIAELIKRGRDKDAERYYNDHIVSAGGVKRVDKLIRVAYYITGKRALFSGLPVLSSPPPFPTGFLGAVNPAYALKTKLLELCGLDKNEELNRRSEIYIFMKALDDGMPFNVWRKTFAGKAANFFQNWLVKLHAALDASNK